MEQYGSLLNFFSEGDGRTMIFSVFGLTFAIIVVFIIKMIMKSTVTKKVRMTTAAGISFQEVEAMHKAGQLSDEEYKRIKSKVAERTVAATQTAERDVREEAIIKMVEHDKDAAFDLLPDELKPKQEITDEEEKPAQAPRVSKSSKPEFKNEPSSDEVSVGDPLGGLAAEPADKADGDGELEKLLKKGAISEEEYRRLKGSL